MDRWIRGERGGGLINCHPLSSDDFVLFTRAQGYFRLFSTRINPVPSVPVHGCFHWSRRIVVLATSIPSRSFVNPPLPSSLHLATDVTSRWRRPVRINSRERSRVFAFRLMLRFALFRKLVKNWRGEISVYSIFSYRRKLDIGREIIDIYILPFFYLF